MLGLIDKVNTNLKGVKLLQLSDEQKVKLKNNYNCKLYLFEYALSAKGDLVISTTKSNYNNLQYYLGFDQAQSDLIRLKVEADDKLVIIYCIEHERVTGLARKLGLVN